MSGPQGSYLLCRCGSYEPVTGTLRQQREAHRAHRVEMGETVQALLPTPRERAAAEAERLRAELAARPSRAEVLRDAAAWLEEIATPITRERSEHERGQMYAARRLRQRADEADGERGAPDLVLPWAAAMPDEDLHEFLGELTAAAVRHYQRDPEATDRQVLAEIERVAGEWRARAAEGGGDRG